MNLEINENGEIDARKRYVQWYSGQKDQNWNKFTATKSFWDFISCLRVHPILHNQVPVIMVLANI